MARPDFTALSSRELAPFIQHTKISVGITRDEIIAHAKETVEFGFGAAMVPGSWVKTVSEVLAGTGIPVATALDFPTVGVTSSAGKVAEAAELVRLGANQIDIGVQVGWLKSGDYDAFRDDIAGVVKAAGVPIKVMLELPLLSEDEKKAAVDLSLEAGVSFLKNASSGSIETASPANIRYLAERCPEGVQVKASGGIKGRAQAIELLEAGAACVGTSAGIEIVTDSESDTTTSY